MRPRTGIAVLLALSLVGWTSYLIFQPRSHPYGDLSRGWYSDHFSHLNAARALLFGGVNIWRTPLAQTLQPLTMLERANVPPDIRSAAGNRDSEAYLLPGTPATKPIVASWSRLPRPYPPGDVLAVLPVALLYQWTDLSFGAACHLLIWIFVLYAHVALFFYLLSAIELKPPALVAGFLTYLEAIHWALEGFYDVTALIPLSLCAVAVSRRAWLWALLAFSAAAFLHYRTFFFAPWAVFFAIQLIRERAWRTWKAREWAAVVGIGLLSFACLLTFAWSARSLTDFPLANPVSARGGDAKLTVGLVVLAIAAVGGFIYVRAWVDAAIAIWLLIMIVNLRQAFQWHSLLLLPWLVLRAPSSDVVRTAIADQIRLILVVALAAIAFRNPLVPSWLAMLP